MAVIYDKVAKKNPQDKSVKWYASVKTIKQVDDKEVAKLIADETTLNAKEAEMAIAQLQKVVLQLLKGGYSVKLGDWASFYLTVSSLGADSADLVTANLIKQVNVRCRFGKEFKDSLSKTEFVPASKFQSE